MITLSAPKLSTIRVILITDNDDPTNNLPDHRKPAIQRAKVLCRIVFFFMHCSTLPIGFNHRRC